MSIEELLKISIKYLEKNIINSEYYIYNEKLIDLRKLTIRKLINEETNLDDWFYYINTIDKEELGLPIEAYLLVVREIIKYDLSTELLLQADYFAKLLINKLLEETHFAMDKDLLYRFVKRIMISNNLENKKKFLLKKVKKLIKVDIETNENLILGFKIDNVNKLEISGYISGLENYYFLSNENIKVIDIKSNTEILNLPHNKRSSIIENDYDILNNYLFLKESNKLSFKNKYERMLMYSAAKYIVEIYDDKTSLIKVSDEKFKIILELKDLLSLEYQERLINKANIENIKTYIDKLLLNPTSEELKVVIKECDNINWIFEILRMAPTVIKEEIPVNIYLEAIMKCSTLDKYNIKIALLCEELIVKNPVIIEEIVGFLVELYKSKVFTKNTINTLEYLRCTITDNKIIDEALLHIRADNEQYDKEFLDKLLKMHKDNEDKKKLDPIINKIINGKHIKITYSIYNIIYDFYSRNNDIRALESLCEAILKNNDKLVDNKITSQDIIKLLNYYINLEKYNTNNILKIINEYKDNNEIMDICIKILENADIEEIDKISKEFEGLYFNIISRIKRRSDIVWKIYIRILINKLSSYEYTSEEIKDLIEELNNILSSRASIKDNVGYGVNIINVIINNYIRLKNNKEAFKYIQLYVEKLSNDDNGQLFKEILSSYYASRDFTKEMLKSLNFTNTDNVDQLLKIAFNKLVDNERYELLIEILKHYKNTEKYEDSLDVLYKYIENADEIESLDYELVIEPIIENINKDMLQDTYKLLILRNDVPISFREKIYSQNSNIDSHIMQHNINKIIEGFKNKETVSPIAKNLSLEKYMDNDDEFQNLVHIGENNKNTCEIVKTKVRKIFKHSKQIVSFIITDELANLDEDLNKLKEYALNYSQNLFSLENSIVLGEYLVSKEEEGKLATSLKLKNLFTEDNDNNKAVIFKEDALYDIIIKYLTNNNTNFEVVDKKTLRIILEKEHNLNEIKNISLSDILNNFNKLIKLQMLLIQNKMIMTEFKSDSFIVTQNYFIPNNFTNICEFEEELICKDSHIFSDIEGIRNKDNKIVINEKNITKIMIRYIKELLSNIKLDENIYNEDESSLYEEEKIKKKFIKELSNTDNIAALEELYKIVDVFLEKQNKIFEKLSYRKQLKSFDDLSLENQIKVVCKAMMYKDTTLYTKSKVIYFEHIPEEDIEDYFKYIIDCYNNTFDLTTEDYGYIYNKVTDLLNSKLISDSVIKEQLNEISILYISARLKCKYEKKDIEENLDSIIYDIDKEYIKSRIE